jgi:hypothetical protein
MYLILLLVFNILFPQPILAQEDTSVSPTQAPNKAVLEMVQQKVKSMLEQNSTQDTVSNNPQSQFGTISQISDTQIIISYQNQNKTITITPDTIFIDAKKNKIKIASIKVGQDILAMGYLDQSNNLTAKRIVVIDLKTIVNNNEIILGKIVDISQSSPIFSLTSIKNKENTYQIKTDGKTEIFDQNNNKLTLSKLKSGQKVVVVIQPDIKLVKTFYVSKIITFDSNSASSISVTPTPKK